MRYALLFLILIAGCSTKSITPIPVLPPIPTLQRQSALSAKRIPKPWTVQLSWDASPDCCITKYTVYWGTNQTALTNSQEVSADTLGLVVSNLAVGPMWWFGVTASDGNSNSDLSNLVHWPPYPRVLTGFTLSWGTVDSVTVYQSHDLQSWASVTNVVDSSLSLNVNSEQTYFGIDKPYTLSLTPIWFQPE